LYIAEAFQADEDHGAADSVLNLVVERYPRSPEAPTALYKRAGALEKAGQTQRALQLYDRVVNDYPESDVVTLAREAAARLRRE
jgi:TolA-binding protein